MNQPTSIIELKALSRAFDGRTVLHDLTLSFPKGLTTVVMGPSGCGKSVMLKHIIGLLKPDSGELWFQPTASTRNQKLTFRHFDVALACSFNRRRCSTR